MDSMNIINTYKPNRNNVVSEAKICLKKLFIMLTSPITTIQTNYHH